MAVHSRRAHKRFKDDRRVCRAILEDESGRSAHLSVIDFAEGGAALTALRDTSRVPGAGGKPITKGRARMIVPSAGARKTTRTVEVGDYEVVRSWPRGLGDDAGVAVRFLRPRKAWRDIVSDDKLEARLASATKA